MSASSSLLDPNLSADSLYKGRCGGRSGRRSKLPDEYSLDFSLLLAPVLFPDLEDRNLDHPDRVDESSFSGKRYLSAGLTATRQAQRTVILVSMTLQHAGLTRSPGVVSKIDPLAADVHGRRTTKIGRRVEKCAVSVSSNDARPIDFLVYRFPWKRRTDKPPVRNKAEIPIFSMRGSCSFLTSGIGAKRITKSVTTQGIGTTTVKMA